HRVSSIALAMGFGDWQGVEDVIAGVRRGILALAESSIPFVVVLDGQVRGAATTCALWAALE
ncbi:hypothetical protein, partial [Klebsiella aerogenes]|uniref:hypothetical protein n=1 Tax=Klebsiella aerogenes TaxID=548 RepID=UPI001954E11D